MAAEFEFKDVYNIDDLIKACCSVKSARWMPLGYKANP